MSQEIAAVYDKLATHFERFPNLKYAWPQLAEQFAGFEPDSIAVLGGGPGAEAAFLLEVFPSASRLTINELSPKMAEMAQNRKYARNIVPQIIVGDFQKPNILPDNGHDLVVQSFGMQYVNPGKRTNLVHDFYKMVAPGGILLLMDKMREGEVVNDHINNPDEFRLSLMKIMGNIFKQEGRNAPAFIFNSVRSLGLYFNPDFRSLHRYHNTAPSINAVRAMLAPYNKTLTFLPGDIYAAVINKPIAA